MSAWSSVTVQHAESSDVEQRSGQTLSKGNTALGAVYVERTMSWTAFKIIVALSNDLERIPAVRSHIDTVPSAKLMSAVASCAGEASMSCVQVAEGCMSACITAERGTKSCQPWAVTLSVLVLGCVHCLPHSMLMLKKKTASCAAVVNPRPCLQIKASCHVVELAYDTADHH